MSKTVFTLTLPEPRVRKKQPRPALAHKNKHLYSRKSKHKTDPRDERDPRQTPATTGVWRLNGVCRPGRPGSRVRETLCPCHQTGPSVSPDKFFPLAKI